MFLGVIADSFVVVVIRWNDYFGCLDLLVFGFCRVLLGHVGLGY